jgi:hypothetical protein
MGVLDMKRILAIVAACGTLAAHAAGVSPSKLTPIDSSEHFEIPAVMTYTERRGLGAKIEQGLREGTYAAKFQDAKGIYFVGPRQAICQGSPPCTAFQHEGGIWVSKDQPEDLRLFLIQELTPEQKASVAQFGPAALLAKIGEGKYYLFPLNKDFAQQLAGTRKP